MANAVETRRPRSEPQPIPIEEDRVKEMLYTRIWEAKFEPAKPGWTMLFRINNDTGEGYVYPDKEDEKGHPGYSFDKDKLEQIWENLKKTFRVSDKSNYVSSSTYEEGISLPFSVTHIVPTLTLPNEPHLVFKADSEMYPVDTAFLLNKRTLIRQEWMVQRLDPKKWERKEYK